MAIFLALMAAFYGIPDFAAGMASRKLTAGPVSAAVVVLTLMTAVVSVLLFPGGENPDAHVIWWGAASGFGSAVGTLALYHGLSVGRMSVVATLSAVLAAVIPAIVGVDGRSADADRDDRNPDRHSCHRPGQLAPPE